MLTGPEIASRIHFILRSTSGKTGTGIGALLGENAAAGSRGNRKRYEDFLKKLRRDHILRNIRICAEYLEIPVEELLLEDFR